MIMGPAGPVEVVCALMRMALGKAEPHRRLPRLEDKAGRCCLRMYAYKPSRNSGA